MFIMFITYFCSQMKRGPTIFSLAVHIGIFLNMYLNLVHFSILQKRDNVVVSTFINYEEYQ